MIKARQQQQSVAMSGFYFYAINTTQQNSLTQKPRQKNLYKIYVQSFLQNRKHNYNNC